MVAHPPAPSVIVADHVSKRYKQAAQTISLRTEASRVMSKVLRRTPPQAGMPFWALRDVNFTIRQGESVALVGRNGSGKSTLFRVLCGITTPTEGAASVHGRFATLIALGAGFNPERTGRQNIYLNAAIQGCNPKEVRERVEDIIAFSELGEFVDVPVKRYSSGMNARLGFSIAVHIFPETIFIDEVLSVGDAAFQEKCIKRILAMKAEGRTIMFVSHSAESVRMLCERAIWLHQGVLQADGPTDQVLDAYNARMRELAAVGQ